jgi:hypothetical protein
MNNTYYVLFANKKTFFKWKEGYPTFTAAWGSYLAFRELNHPEKYALEFLGKR